MERDAQLRRRDGTLSSIYWGLEAPPLPLSRGRIVHSVREVPRTGGVLSCMVQLARRVTC